MFFVATAQAASPAAPTGQCPKDPTWSDPARPAHIYGNTWYVGTCGISAILITSANGHVLLDGATEQAAPSIEENVRALGFKLEDIKFILSSHEHLDHAGGIARLQKDSAATVVAREPAATTLERGSNDRSDPQFGVLQGFPPINTIRRINDREILTLGDLTLTAHATPGHTAGSTSWTWKSCESGDCRNMVYADSLTAVSADDYRFSDEQAHPDVVPGFRRAFKIVADLPCDILMTPHPGASHLFARLGPGASEALVDPRACIRYAEAAAKTLDSRLSREKSAVKP
ncbi:MAG: subclass B3 metallo-beta-lactamase [Dokdonella sp.]